MNSDSEEEDIDDLPPKPREPDASECCGSGCSPCVYDIYEEELARLTKDSLLIQNRIKKNSLSNDSHENTIPSSVPFNIKFTGIQSHEFHQFSSQNPILTGQVMERKTLTSPDFEKVVFHIELKLTNKLHYLPGDAIGIFSPNKKEDVEFIIQHLNLNPDEIFEIEIVDVLKKGTIPKHIPIRVTPRQVFTYHVSIYSIPSKTFLKTLANFTENSDDKLHLELLCSNKGEDEYQKTIVDNYTTFVDLLKQYPSIHPRLEEVIYYLPQNFPRYFSIANDSEDEIHLCINLTQFKTKRKKSVRGLCSSFLHEISMGDSVSFFHRKSGDFVIEKDPTIPLILIATGTGISPFRSFLMRRHYQRIQNPENQFGKILLFYGCRHLNKDFLYFEDLQKFQENGTLTKLISAFSRDPPHKHYITKKIWENKGEIIDLMINSRGKIYVCGGDESTRSIYEAMKMLFNEAAKENPNIQNIGSLMDKFEKEKRYIRDIWISLQNEQF